MTGQVDPPSSVKCLGVGMPWSPLARQQVTSPSGSKGSQPVISLSPLDVRSGAGGCQTQARMLLRRDSPNGPGPPCSWWKCADQTVLYTSLLSFDKSDYSFSSQKTSQATYRTAWGRAAGGGVRVQHGLVSSRKSRSSCVRLQQVLQHNCFDITSKKHLCSKIRRLIERLGGARS